MGACWLGRQYSFDWIAQFVQYDLWTNVIQIFCRSDHLDSRWDLRDVFGFINRLPFFQSICVPDVGGHVGDVGFGFFHR